MLKKCIFDLIGVGINFFSGMEWNGIYKKINKSVVNLEMVSLHRFHCKVAPTPLFMTLSTVSSTCSRVCITAEQLLGQSQVVFSH